MDRRIEVRSSTFMRGLDLIVTDSNGFLTLPTVLTLSYADAEMVIDLLNTAIDNDSTEKARRKREDEAWRRRQEADIRDRMGPDCPIWVSGYGSYDCRMWFYQLRKAPGILYLSVGDQDEYEEYTYRFDSETVRSLRDIIKAWVDGKPLTVGEDDEVWTSPVRDVNYGWEFCVELDEDDGGMLVLSAGGEYCVSLKREKASGLCDALTRWLDKQAQAPAEKEAEA